MALAQASRRQPVAVRVSPPGTSEDIHVAFPTDSSYLPWCATAIQSCADHDGSALRFHVLHDGTIDEGDQDRLEKMAARTGASLVFYGFDSADIAHLPAVDRFGRVVWLRMMLPDILPDLDRVLYLDADTFIVEPLRWLWQQPLGEAPLAAVANVAEPGNHPHIKELGILDPAGFFNSGV